MRIRYDRASSEDELRQILQLQKRNALTALSTQEKEEEGFITVAHSFEILKRMNDVCPHIVAKDGRLVVGYALVMTPSFRNEIPVLISMFDMVDTLFVDRNYVVMGQVCVAKSYRKVGVFREMYSFYKKELEGTYECLFTQVASENIRSLHAHLNVGFKIVKRHVYQNVSWELIRRDWR